jgi:CRISPR/Cas system endoribonuclease Cas6 (RAMP superfamily)
MDELDIKQERTGYTENRKPIEYVYFGWDWVKWYPSHNDINFIENFITDLDEVHFVRIGEEKTDIEEIYNLQETDVEGIQISRHFDEEV